jgi:hypothetical protein
MRRIAATRIRVFRPSAMEPVLPVSWVSLRSKPLSYHLAKLRTGYQALDDEAGRQIALSPGQRRLIGAVNRLANPLRYLRRRWLAGLAIAAAPGAPRVHDGHVIIRGMEGHEALIEACERQLAIYFDFLERGDAALAERGIDPAAYRAEIEKTHDDPLKHVPCHYDREALGKMLDFALQPQLVACAARHLGVLPVLVAIRILYSPNADGALDRAQLFHVDPEGERQAKGFMAIRRVGPENSPFTFVPRGLTRAMMRSGQEAYRWKRVPDKYIARAAPPEQWIAHTGDAGDGLIVDTSQCFHFGSRPNVAPRFLFYFSYLDPFGSFFPLRYPTRKASQAWTFYDREPSRFTDFLLSRRM